MDSCNPTDSASTTDTSFPPPPAPENEVMTASCNPTDSASTTGGCCTPIVGVAIESCNSNDSASTTDIFFSPPPAPLYKVFMAFFYTKKFSRTTNGTPDAL